MLVQRIYSVFRMKPLDMRHLQEDTMLMRQQRRREKSDKEHFEWLKLKMIEKETPNERDQQFTIYDIRSNLQIADNLHEAAPGPDRLIQQTLKKS
ncbi:hypothetical protein ACI65C_009809 [Semiaphis heraclei]